MSQTINNVNITVKQNGKVFFASAMATLMAAEANRLGITDITLSRGGCHAYRGIDTVVYATSERHMLVLLRGL